MSDIKLFHINRDQVTELKGSSAKIEKSLQEQIENGKMVHPLLLQTVHRPKRNFLNLGKSDDFLE